MNFTRACRKVVCVGRNFAEHAKELNNPIPKIPLLFLKPPSSFLEQGQGPIEVPPGLKALDHEVELGVIIGKKGRDISEADAMSYVKGWFLGLDMTARELQEKAKKSGTPWSVAKGYDTFAAVGRPIPLQEIKDPSKLELWLKVNNTIRQNGKTSDMIFSIPSLISYISTIYTLEEGDCIFTGTPSGVGPVVPGDVITAGVRHVGSSTDISTLSFTVAERAPPRAKL